MWQVLAVAGAAMVLGAVAPSAGVRAATRFDGQAAAAQASPSGQGGAARGTAPSAKDDSKGRPNNISASNEWLWWSDPDIRKQLNLSDEKAKKLETIFQRRLTEIQPAVDSLNREREKLNRMTNDRMADEVTYSLQVAKVEFLASKFRESRTIMLYRMFRELTPEQYRKLQEIGDKRLDDLRRRGLGGGR